MTDTNVKKGNSEMLQEVVDPQLLQKETRQKGAEDDRTVHRFIGNDSHTDYFRLVMRDGDSLIVGGRNFDYNLFLHDLK
ncbi:hypothetical protein QE152_g32250 [Popillia japonica]|uniref:Uncharacterized protein n=1 Tax=Popillia japonica TaxID=7064 RepID=A0AAW1IZY1_POPJA